MKRRRIHLELGSATSGDTVEIPDDRAHYLADVLRLSAGERVEVFDGEGASFVAEYAERERIVLLEKLEIDRESPCAITLYQSIAKGDRFEWVLEKSTELGVARIVPLETARTVVRIKPAKVEAKLERWSRICASASRQSGRTVVPEVARPASVAAALEHRPCAVELVMSPTADVDLRAALEETTPSVGIWVGPEGGFTSAEVEQIAARATPVRFGPRILRTETAGIAAITAVQLLTAGLE